MTVSRLLYENYGLAAAWTASSAVPTLPPTNCARPERRRVWRSTGVAAEWLTADLGFAQEVGGVALVDPTLTPDALITIEASPSDSWPGVWSETLGAWDPGESGVLVWFFAAPQTYRWWRLSLADAANPSGYLQIGVPVLSAVFDFATGPGPFSGPPTQLGLVDPSLTEYSPMGTPSTFDLPTHWEASLPFGVMDESALVYPGFVAAMRAMGTKRDGVLSLRADAPAASPAAIDRNRYGRFVEAPGLSYADPRYYQTMLKFRESR